MMPIGYLLGAVLAVASAKAHSWETLSVDFGYEHFASDDQHATRDAVGDIKEGDGARLDLIWNASESWYVHGMVAHAELRYPDRQNPSCPMSTGVFVPPTFFCTAGGATPSSGGGEDSFWTSSLRLGRRFPVLERWSMLAELGVTRLEWTSNTDLEARALTQCRLFGPDSTYDTSVRNENCAEIAKQASATGLSARVGTEATLWARLVAHLSFAFEANQYEVFRNDVIPRFVSANCSGTFNCTVQQARRASRLRSGSSTWVRGELRLPVSEQLSLFLGAEGGGTRDWDVYSAGVRWSF